VSSRELSATLYPLDGVAGARFRLRILKVREAIPQDNHRPRRLQRWADDLWRRHLRCPVYPTGRFGDPAFLIPEGGAPSGTTIEVHDVPDKHYHIDVTEQLLEVAVDDATPTERELVCRMLERPFTDALLARRDRFWRTEWTLFFRLTAENAHVRQDVINAYRGMKFGVVLLQGEGPHFAADIRTRYVGRRSLLAYNPDDRRALLGDHLDLDARIEDRSSFLRDNGPIKLACRYAGEVGKTLDACTFDDSGETVYTYYRRRYPGLHVDPSEPTVFVQDREGGATLPVPASRLFPIFTTEYEGVRQCSIKAQMSPTQRAQVIEEFLREIPERAFDGRYLAIRRQAVRRPRTVFPPPRLEFGAGEIIAPFSGGHVPSATSQAFDSAVVKWGSLKLPALHRWGPHHNEPLPDGVLIYPSSLDRQTREGLVDHLAREIQLQTKQRLPIRQQRAYEIGAGERMGGSLLRAVRHAAADFPRGIGIVVLWDRLMQRVHGDLKEHARPMLSQCVTERVARGIAAGTDPQRAASAARNLALGVLIEAGVKPWVLADPLHHDVFIGIDLLYGRVGYHILYGTGGRVIKRAFGESLARGRMAEAVKRPDLRSQVESALRAIVAAGHPTRSLVIHRDGRWWPSESAGLADAVKRMTDENLIPRDFRYAVLEIRKNHLPVRLFTSVVGHVPPLLNPLPGTYLLLDSRRVLLTTTGRPGAWDTPRGRTAASLLVEVVDANGTVDAEELAEDVYRLTHLNWSSPDIEIGLPVTIRWTDEGLRETLRHAGSGEEEDEDVEEGDQEDSVDPAREEAE
jgi:hypothetical protein